MRINPIANQTINCEQISNNGELSLKGSPLFPAERSLKQTLSSASLSGLCRSDHLDRNTQDDKALEKMLKYVAKAFSKQAAIRRAE